MMTRTFAYPNFGYDLICFDLWMYLGDLTGNLPIEKRDVPFGEHLFVAGESLVTQIGDERGSAVWQMFRFIDGSSLLYLGVFRGDLGEMLIFQPMENNQPKYFERNLFGDIHGKYKNLFVAFNYLSPDELHISTRSLAARVFRPTVVFAENNQRKTENKS